MAVKGFATTPKGILSGIRRIAPNVSIGIRWEVDPYFVWDGDGPKKAERGFIPHNVYVSAVVVTMEGKTVFGRGALLARDEVPGQEDPNIGGYLPQMLATALDELHNRLVGKRIWETRSRGRKEWDPREAREGRRTRIELATEVRAAAEFVERSSDEIDNRAQRRA